MAIDATLPTRMKAAVYRKFGGPDVVAIEELPVPQPRPDQVLIRVRASTVSAADWRMRSATFPPGFAPLARPAIGLMRPRNTVLGTELAGDVVAVGSAVTCFKPGDAVFAALGAKLGGHAEYVCVDAEGAVAPKPANLDYESAAALSFGGNAALHYLERAAPKAGERVLVNGASGCVGSAAVQIARHLGAHVTGVCSGGNAALVRTLGAAHCVDYASEDFAAGHERYDVIFDAVGNAGYVRSRAALARGGRLALVAASLGEMLAAPFQGRSAGHKVIVGVAADTRESALRLHKLAEDGAFVPVIDQVFAFDDIRAAHARVDSGRKRGSVVVRMGASNPPK